MGLTTFQQRAVDFEGSSLLVSAAAGSGKTFVLTQRVIRKLCDKTSPVDADKLMILTFTEAAANEMRERILAALREELAKDPANENIRRQMLLLPSARISTIHSACLELIRENFDRLGIDPQFTVCDENRASLIKNDMLEGFVESVFERARTDKAYAELAEYFTFGDNKELYEVLTRLSAFIEKQPYPELYVGSVLAKSDNDVFSLVPHDLLYTLLTARLRGILKKYDALIDRASHITVLSDFYKAERERFLPVLSAIEDRDFDGAVTAAGELAFSNHPNRKKEFPEWETLASYRNALKTATIDFFDTYLFEDSKSVLEDRKRELSLLETLLGLCLEFNEKQRAYRTRNRLMSYDDMERYALRLLVTTADGVSFEKTELAKELSADIAEIIVDEYQDCNLAQDLIFYALSRDMRNVFMVGDVKQSIYRFRGAQPELFLAKQRDFEPATSDRANVPSRLDLNCNFRSSEQILEFANAVFEKVMTKDSCGIDYDDSHKLVTHPAVFCDGCAGICVDLVVHRYRSNAAKEVRVPLEAQFVAKRIRELVEGGELMTDTKTGKTRRIRYSDIAVLMRAPKNNSAFYEKAFDDAGISYINNNANENYLDNLYVKSVLAFLQAIDNPYDEIPLVTVMYSDFFSFTANELGAIRAVNKYLPFYDALREYSKTDAKAAAFISMLEGLRTFALTGSVYAVISAIYEKSGIFLKLSDKKGGDEIKANLMLLQNYAASFESSGYKGLFAFIGYVGKLIENGDTVPSARIKTSSDSVSIYSIHKSKGLEYPVIFLVNAADPLDISRSKPVAMSGEYGVGAQIRDNVRHRKLMSPIKSAIDEAETKSDIAEQLRALYVALTRAKNRLYVTAGIDVKSFEKTVAQVDLCQGEPAAYDIITDPSYLKWLLFGLYGTKGYSDLAAFAGSLPVADTKPGLAKIAINADEPETLEETVGEGPRPAVTFDEDGVRRALTRAYSFEKSTRIPAKLSVSDIKSKGAQKRRHYKPSFVSGRVRGADVGNATHGFLQYCDFTAVTDMPSLENELARLVDNEFITSSDAKLINKDGILEFLTSKKLTELIADGSCKREDRFIFTLPAREVTDIDSDEPVVIQGIIDCWFLINGKAVILDYKTDIVKTEAELCDKYRVQLELYERAITDIYGYEVSDKYIYSFCLGCFIKV